MAKYLSRGVMRVACVVVLLMTGDMSIAWASDLIDPTRPPASLGIFRGDDGGVDIDSGPILQSVLISPGRRIAIISGHAVQVGEKVGDATVVKIADDEVTMRSGTKMETLKIFPGIEKKPTSESARPKSIIGGNKGKP